MKVTGIGHQVMGLRYGGVDTCALAVSLARLMPVT